MEPEKEPCISLDLETDGYYKVIGLTRKRYVRVQAGKNDFFIPANVFRKAAFTLSEGERLVEQPVSVERLKDDADGRRLAFTIKTRHGEFRRAMIAGDVIDEIVERIDQVKSLMHSYYADRCSVLQDEEAVPAMTGTSR